MTKAILALIGIGWLGMMVQIATNQPEMLFAALFVSGIAAGFVYIVQSIGK